MKQCFTISLLLMIFTLHSCSNETKDESKFKPEIEKIKNTLNSNVEDQLVFKATSLDGGVAIMGYIDNNPIVAFWVSNGIVYAANGTAMSWSGNSIDYSPTGIDFSSILKALEE